MSRLAVNSARRLFPDYLRRKLPSVIKAVEIGEEKSRTLNLIYRRKNKAANVLSFRYGGDYGEILVCPSVVSREAKEAGEKYKDRMSEMIIHGMLHLAGAHHEKSPAAAEKFAELERVIAKKCAGRLRRPADGPNGGSALGF